MRKATLINRVTGRLDHDMNRELVILQMKTGKSKSSLIREALTLLFTHYKRRGY